MRLRDRISLGISGAALLSSVLLIGGALRWTQSVVGALVAIALASQIFVRRRLDRASPLLIMLAAAIGLTALQLVPLPTSVVEALNPVGENLRLDGAQLAGTSPWTCISLDPPGTARALAFFVILFGIATLALRFAANERGRYYALAGVALTCGVAAAVTGMHTLVSASSLYGLYEPLHAEPPVLGPLLNPNHLGCLMALGSVVAIGLAFYDRQTSHTRVLWVVISVGCALVVFASESRGAALGLMFGVMVTVASVVAARLGARDETARQRRSSLARDVPVALVIAVGLAVAVYTTAGNVADQIDNTTLDELNHPLSKFEAWKSSMTLVAETPWVGIGRGAVEPALTRVHDASAYATFSHLENEYVSAIVEWGVPGALLLAWPLGWCMLVAVRRWRDGPLAAGGLGAMAAVMFQSSVDFGVELLGVAVPATIVAATLLIAPFRETTAHRRVRLQRVGLVLTVLAAALVLLLPALRTLQEDHDDLQDIAATATFADYQEVIERHPLDYFGFGKGSELLARKDDPRAVPLLDHALALHASHPGLHRVAARMLVESHHIRQAALEYSLAMHGTLLPKPLLSEIVTTLPDAKDAASAIPPDWEPVDRILRTLTELKREDVSVYWLARVIEQPQPDTNLIDTLYDLAVSQQRWEIARRAAEVRLATAHTATSRLMVARIQFQQKEYAALIPTLSDVSTWHGRIDEQSEAWLILCDSYSQTQQLEAALECLHRLDGTGIMLAKRAELVRRIRSLEDQRATEVKLRELARHGYDIPMPAITPSSPSTPSTPTDPTKPGSSVTPAPLIENPLQTSPLKPKSK